MCFSDLFSSSCLAVRFGRIPKREKQRMLLEMQNAMNNMMTTSQLHHMLHGTQTAPCPTEPIPIPVPNTSRPSPTSSSVSSSLSSSSSDPSSPQSVSADSESNVPMDTSLSSPSSCASDSGEEDAVTAGSSGSCTVVQENMFAFKQERPARSPISPARSSPSLGLAEQLSQSSMEECPEYGRHRNDNMTNTSHRSYHPVYTQQPQSWSYREERSGYGTIQQLNGAPSGTYAANSQSSYHYSHSVKEQAPAVSGNRGHLVSVMSGYH